MEDNIKHGTSYGYQKCRKQPQGSCEECKTYNRETAEERREKALKKFREDPESFTHGTPYTFKLGCGCDLCKEYGSKKNRKYWADRKIDVIPEDAHGTPRGYNYYKCRCDDCDAAIKFYRVLIRSQRASRRVKEIE